MHRRQQRPKGAHDTSPLLQVHLWYTGRMKPLDMSPPAKDEWDHIIDRDRKLAEAVQPLLDDIESGEIVGERFQNGARFVTFRIPGRDELFVVVWVDRGNHLYVLRIGRVSV